MAPLFDAASISAASGLQSSTLAQSWSHTVGGGANNIGILVVEATNSGSGGFQPTGSPAGTASCGAQALTYLNSQLMGATVIAGFVSVFVALGVPTGSQTVSYSMSCPGQNVSTAHGTFYTYTGVGSYGTLQLAQGVSTAPLVAVASAVGRLVFGALSNYSTGSYSSLSFTPQQTNTADTPFFVAGDMAGAASVNISGTQSAGFHWAALGLDMLPAAAGSSLVVPSLKVTQAINRASRY